MKNKQNTVSVKYSNFDFTQLNDEIVSVRLVNIEPVCDKENVVVNYRLMLELEGIENAVVRCLMYNVGKDGLKSSIRTVTALQLEALGAIKKTQKTLPSGKVIDTGYCEIDESGLNKYIGREYQARVAVMNEIKDGRAFSWVLLIPAGCDGQLVENIREMRERAKASKDVLDEDSTVSFDRLRDSELRDITGEGW